MRRRFAALTLPTAAIVTAALAAPSGAAADRTGPTGPFGITTVGLGAGSAYGEPSLAMAADGKHYAVSSPGDNDQKKGTVQVWHSADRGLNWAHTWFTSDEGGGDSERGHLQWILLCSRGNMSVTDISYSLTATVDGNNHDSFFFSGGF